MKTHAKITLIMKFQLQSNEVNFIDSLNLPIDYEEIVEKETYQILSDSFSQILADERLNEIELLQLAYINSKIKGLTITFNPKFNDEDYNEEFDEDNDFEEDPEIEEYNKSLSKRRKNGVFSMRINSSLKGCFFLRNLLYYNLD